MLFRSNFEEAWIGAHEIYFDMNVSSCCGSKSLDFIFYNNESKSEVIVKAKTNPSTISPQNNYIDLLLPSDEPLGSLFIYACHAFTTMFLDKIYQGRLQFFVDGLYYADIFDKNERKLYTGRPGFDPLRIHCCDERLVTMCYPNSSGTESAFSIDDITGCTCGSKSMRKLKIIKHGTRFPGGILY